MIDKSKQYRTRDGREVRIYATDGGGEGNIIHGAVKGGNYWGQFSWHNTGCYFEDGKTSIHDLIEARPRIQREVWLNVYRDPRGGYHESKYEADRYGGNRIACVKLVIDCEEGTGL